MTEINATTRLLQVRAGWLLSDAIRRPWPRSYQLVHAALALGLTLGSFEVLPPSLAYAFSGKKHVLDWLHHIEKTLTAPANMWTAATRRNREAVYELAKQFVLHRGCKVSLRHQ